MRLLTRTIAAAIAAVGYGLVGAPAAHAVPIGGTFALIGTLNNALTTPGSTSIVSQLPAIDFNVLAVSGAQGDFVGGVGLASFKVNLSSPQVGSIYSLVVGADTFQFDMTTVDVSRTALTQQTDGQFSDFLHASITGTVVDTANLFTPTTFTISWSASGTCSGTNNPATCTGNVISEGGVTFTATGKEAPPPSNVPEPASMAMLGAGLVGIGAVVRRRRRA